MWATNTESKKAVIVMAVCGFQWTFSGGATVVEAAWALRVEMDRRAVVDVVEKMDAM